MIHVLTKLDAADNSGAKKIKCIKVIGGSQKKCARIGDIIVVSVVDAMPRGKVKKGEVYHAVVVRTAKEIRRHDGTYIKFDRNAGVLIDKQGEPLGSRVFGPIPRDLRENFMKIISLAPEVL